MCRCVGGQGARTHAPEERIGKRVGEGAGRSALPTHLGTYGDPQCLPPLHRHTPPTSSGHAGGVERANGRLGSLFTSGGGIRCIWGLRRRPERLLEPEAFHFLATPAAAEAAREVEGESRSLTTAGGSETLRPDARVPPGPALSTRARSSRRRRGRGLLGAPPPVQSRGLGRGCGPPTESAPRARCPRPVPGGERCARSGIPERPAPGPAPFLPASLLALGAAFRLVAPGCGGQGRGRPGITGARAAGGRARGRRECARAARGSAGGRGAEARAGSLPPPIPEKGACPRNTPARGRKRRFVALGITPVSSRPWAGRGRSQVVEPSLVRRLRPLSDLCGRVREMGARVGVSEPFGSGPWRSSRCPACWARSVLGLRRPDRPGPEPAGRLRTRGLGDGHEADPAKPDEQRGASNLPWSPRPLAGPPGPAPPPERVLGPKPAPWGRLQLRQGRRAPGRGGGGGGRRAVAFGRERAPAPPAACPPLPSLPWPRRPPHPGQPWPPPPSRRCRWSLTPASGRERCDLCLSTLAWPPDLRALCTGVRSMFVFMCATRARVCPAGRLAACVGRHANCHMCVWRGAGLCECAPWMAVFNRTTFYLWQVL